MSWSRLIRFIDNDGNTSYGDVDATSPHEVSTKLHKDELYATVLEGNSPSQLRVTGQRKQVRKLVAVLNPSQVPIIRCIGLNYMKHIAEGGRNPPPYPSLFIKPSTSIAGFDEDIPIPRIAQEDQLDYEGELAVVVGKTGKDIPAAEALSYVLGYATANDLSARTWQRDPAYAGSVPQWCFSKGFDKFAPLGPMLISPRVVNDGSGLRLTTLVNGEVRQDSNTDDLLFNVPTIVSFLSQGTTIEEGTVILTGTPSGVAMGMKTTPKYMRNGDVVEVKIEQLGSCINRMVFE